MRPWTAGGMATTSRRAATCHGDLLTVRAPSVGGHRDPRRVMDHAHHRGVEHHPVGQDLGQAERHPLGAADEPLLLGAAGRPDERGHRATAVGIAEHVEE